MTTHNERDLQKKIDGLTKQLDELTRTLDTMSDKMTRIEQATHKLHDDFREDFDDLLGDDHDDRET